MTPYPSSGTLTTDEREVAVSETWDSDAEWNAAQSMSNVVVENGVVMLEELPDIPASAVAHFDAQELSGFSDGDPVSTFPDSVNGNDASGSGTYRPSAINGNPAIELNGSSDSFDAPIGTYSQRNVVYAVVQLTGSTSDGHAVFDGQASGGRNHVWWAQGDGAWNFYAGSTINASADDTTMLFTADYNGASSALREDGTQTASGDVGSNGLEDFRIGINQSGGQNFAGYVGFFEVHDGAPSNGLQTREQEIADQWGITI